MAFDELDRLNEPPERKKTAVGGWDNLSDKERKERFARRERLGLVAAQDDGFFGELSDQFQGSVISALKGVGATANELGLGSGMQDYFQGVLDRNQQWNTPEERSVAGYIGGAIGNAAGSTAVIAPAIAADALFGTKGAATFALVFGQSFGDNLQRNRAVYGPGNEEKSIGLAAAESTVDSFIEIALGTVPMLGKSLKGLTYAGKRQLVKGMFREAEKQLGRSGAKRFFLGLAKNGGEEMTEEGLQYINNWMWRAIGGDQSNEFKFGEMADNMGQGFIGGVGLGIVGGRQDMNLYGKPRPWLNPRTSENTAAAPSGPPAPGASPASATAPVADTVNPTPETETFNPEEAKSTSARLTEEVAKEFGLKVRYFDEEGAPSPVDDKGNPVNGWYDEKTNEYWIDRNDPEMNPLETLGHEFKHFLDQNHSDLVKTFDELLKSGMNDAGKQALSETETDYRQSGYPAGQGEIEFSADTFGKMWTDPEFWRDVANRAEKLNAGMGQRMLDALQEFIKIVRAKLKNIGTPEAKELFDNMGELRSEAARIMAEIKRRNGTSTEAENVVGVKGSDMVQSIPVADLNIDPARFQFKSKANKETGVDESNKLGGEWDPKTAGNLYVWEDKSGKKFVVNGHHRFQLAKNSRVQAVNAIVDREADGVSAEQARRNGVLINIRDEQGDVKDYADFVRHEDMSEGTAEKEGILAREKGRRGYTIGKYASDNLYSIFKSDEISEAKAETIADIARKDEGLEAAGIRAAKTMPNAQLREFLKCLKNMPREKTEQGDLFGFDDSAIQMSEKLSKLAAKHIREIADKLKAVRQAVKNPETAAKGDVKVGKNAQKIYDQTLRDQLEWEHWYTNPELSAQLRKEAGIEDDILNTPDTPDTPDKSVVKENLTTDGRFNIDSDTPLLTPEEDANDFQLIDETREEAARRDRLAEQQETKKQERIARNAARETGDLFGEERDEAAKTVETRYESRNPAEDAKLLFSVQDDVRSALLDGNYTERERSRKLSSIGIPENVQDELFKLARGEKNKENIYLKMPVERVRQDAENGVKLAQDALKILEKQTAADYINDKENGNASSTSTHLERGSEIRNAENGADATSLRNDGRADSRVSGQGGRSTGSAGLRTETDTGNADASSQSDGSGSRAMDGGTLSGDGTGAADRSQSSGSVENRPSGIRTGNDANGANTDNHTAEEAPRKPKSQEEADRVKVIPRDRKNIAETLPTLFPEQCDDVFKAEQRYSHGKGMLFTNATGTGKTFTGLGIVKRFVRQGKGNVLIVTPTDKKNRDWANDAKRVNLTVTPLSGTGDNGGTGIAVTTYANFRQNESLLRRNWDLLVFDESHKISSAEGKIDTLAKQQLDRLAGVKDIPFRRAFEENKAMLRDELGKIDPDYLNYDLERNPESKNPVLSVRDIEEHWEDLPKSVQKKLKDREAELSRSKVLFLSATPFSYHNSLLYADGYLFDIPEREAHGYNAPDGVQDFFITNFGYRMRYNKLTKPDSDVDVGVMERAFYEKMRKSGAVSGRMLDIDKDYSREFFRVQSDLGEKIQAGMDMVMDYKQYPAISALIHKLYDYNYVTSLLECLKSKATVDEIKKDLAAGRKVVVFHNRNTGTPAHPFHLGVLYNYVENERQHQKLKEEIERFETEHPELVHLRLNDLQNPLLYFRKMFGDKALFFDGTVPAKKRAMNVEEFNDAKSGKNLIVVQIEAGKEGISLHDTKGDAQRVLYNLGLPTKPTDLIQSEGRIYRLGSKSNAIFRYPVTGLPMERYAFGSKINQRASTAENLGMGDAARNLRDALREGYMNAGESLSFEQQGIGGKEADRGYDAASDYDRAKTFYFGQQKRTSKNKSAEGIDYFATPEPIGYKMVEWAHLNPGDRVLEPSAGHGAIARFLPDTVDAKAIEPSTDLSSKLTVNTTAQVIRGRFEDHNAVNKYDCVLMNPPFGVGGKTAIEHLAKAFDRHLNNFGRVIAIIPEGGMADRRFSAWLNNTEDAHLTAEIGLPQITFQRAGTAVKTKIVVIDKADSYSAEYLPSPQQRIDISADNINELFDRMENITMPRRGSYDSMRSYSLKRHKQVNPIREPGDVQSQHEARLDEPYETRSNAALNEQAKRRIVGMGGFDETIKMILSGDFAIGTDVSQRILQLVLNSDDFKKLNADARAKISDLYIRDAGTEIARSLAARRLGVLKADDIKSIQAHINAFMAKIDKKKPHNDLRKQILDEFGYDIDNLPEELANDPDKLDGIIRKMMAERATIFDKAYEFWLNSILSGIPTHLANTMGNVSNVAYELGVKRLAEAAINVAAKRKDGATFGEFKEMCRAIDWKGAFERADRSFRLETITNTGKLDQTRTAIGGKTGRAIRYPSRLLRAADEFAKAIVQPVEAAAYAYREGTANKLKGEDLKTYIATQIQQEGSTANEFGHKRAMELTFQEEPGKAVEQLIRWREAGGVFGTLLKFELPFIKTPANILRQGVRKSPVGAVNLAWQTGKALAGKRNFDGQYISLMAEQLVAWGCVAMLAGGMDDDDDQPFLTGTSPRYGSAEQKFKANKLPPYSIRIGDNYYSYKRIEPLATGLAFIADGLDAFRRAKRGEDGTRIMKRLIGGVKQLVAEKSFLDSLGEINRVVSDPERSFMQSITNFASSWMPNVVRQTINLWDDNVRENRSRAKGAEWLEDQFQITTNRMGITRGAPKLDYFGREIKKDSLADSGPLWPLMRLVPIQSITPDENMNKAERLIWQYNQSHQDAEYYPDVPAFYFKRDGKKLYMTGENYQEFSRKSGELALRQINNAFRHGLLHENNPTEKDIDLIKKIFTRARKEIRDEMYRKRRYSE